MFILNEYNIWYSRCERRDVTTIEEVNWIVQITIIAVLAIERSISKVIIVVIVVITVDLSIVVVIRIVIEIED